MRTSNSFRIAMAWQSVAIVAAGLVAAGFGGLDALLSSVLGGTVALLGYVAFWWFSRLSAKSARDVLRVAIRAESVKLTVIVLLLWLSFVAYPRMVVAAFMCAFVASTLFAGFAAALSSNFPRSSTRS